MAQHSNRDAEPREPRRYVSEPTEAQGRWPDGFYSGAEDDRARRYAERPHGWGEYESNYGVARGEWRRVDTPHPADHAGKGPKGYQRSDARTREIICEALAADPYIDASELEVQVEAGQVTLSGTVSDRWTKFAAEELVDQCARAGEINNELRVADKKSESPSRSEWPIGS